MLVCEKADVIIIGIASVLQIWNLRIQSIYIYICNWKYISDSVFVCFVVVVLSACFQNTGSMLDFVALIWSVQLSACEQYVFVVGLVVTEKEMYASYVCFCDLVCLLSS